MIWHINSLKAISLSMSLSPSYTTLVFPEPVIGFLGAKQGTIRVFEVEGDQNTLMFELLSKQQKTSITVVTKSKKRYTFSITHDKKYYQPLVNIKDAKFSPFGKIHETSDFELIDGDKSIFIKPKKDTYNVDGILYSSAQYFSKGPVLRVNSTHKFYNGKLERIK